ncbi:mismatch-specific DNA-glycosylase [Caldimonas sp.]|uniref:mismatch-specific DNA-glycosylase n=1 Tax=Caldimonas sp. TaxID=2838790 RepID=UPI00391ADB2A
MTILRDVLEPNLAIVFCGTAAGNASARRRAYYAGRGNRFWSTLFNVGLTPRELKPEEYMEVIRLGLGLTDLVKSVSGNDNALAREHFDPDRLRQAIRKFHPRILAFTSKRAATAFLGRPVGYGLLPEECEATKLFVLPSPSGAARRYWCQDHWHDLASLKQALALG